MTKEQVDTLIQSLASQDVSIIYQERINGIVESLRDISEHWREYSDKEKNMVVSCANILLSAIK